MSLQRLLQKLCPQTDPLALAGLLMEDFVCWLDDMAAWLFAIVVVLFFSLYGVIGLLVTRTWIRRR